MFHPDFRFDAPTCGDLLAELGIDPMTVREVVDDDRAIRCPERAVPHYRRRFADPCREAAPAEPPCPGAARRAAGRRSRRA